MVSKKLEYRRLIYAVDEKEILEIREVRFFYNGEDLKRVEEAKNELSENYPSAMITTARDIRTFYMQESEFIKLAALVDEEAKNEK